MAGSTYRPRDWSPLAPSDPVPGDPQAIRDEVRHMQDLAKSLRDQAHELKIIGHGEGLKGKYADKLRDKSNELEKHLREVAERYEHTNGYLSSWADELEGMQAESVKILHAAQATEDDVKAKAAQAQAAGHPPAAHSDPHDDPMKPHHDALQALTDHRDERAAFYARKIKSASDDIIKDSAWEHFEDVVGDVLNNKWVKLFFEIASWVVTIVGLIALVLTPAGWIMALVTALTIAIAAKDILAAATGNGSWFDVGMDILSFVGVGLTGKALKTLTKMRAATKIAAKAAAGEEAAANVLNDSRNVLDRTYRITNSRTASKAEKAAARQIRNAIKAQARQAAEAASRAEGRAPRPEVSKWEAALYGGEEKPAQMAKDIRNMQARYGDSQAVQDASKHVGRWDAAARAAFVVPATADAFDKGLGSSDVVYPGKWSYKPYTGMKESFTAGIGS
ncbi:MAG: hypothetical protein JO362_21380, partial [Streptomycetaceae bacterium]|nr:hypothetical protein [Streptomycetaceae bacterium]